jgi:peptidoglycan hydrolase-like protein with peptidoglycan-binding domain
MKLISISPRASFFAASLALSLALAAPLAMADTLTRQLQTGMSGNDVSSLQTFLAQDSAIYPQGLVTGYFGFLTKAAVSNFQSANNLPAVGRVGPQTLALINQHMNGAVGGDAYAPVISSLAISTATTSASFSWSTNKPALGIVYYSTSQLTLNEKNRDVEISGTSAFTDTTLHTSQTINLASLAPNTTYYYVVYTKDSSGNVQITWPSNFKTQ